MDFVLKNDFNCASQQDVDWGKCFICQTTEAKSVALTTPWKSKVEIFSLHFSYFHVAHQ